MSEYARIAASPFRWIDPADIPEREWIYGEHYIRGFVSTTVSPGGVGKSSLAIVEGLAMASGRPLLGVQPVARSCVWLWNGEDPIDELQRRIMAAAKHYEIKRDELEGWLFVNSGRQTEIVLAEQARAGVVIVEPVIADMKATIAACKIDVVVIDPFVSSHRVTENDNNAIDRVVKTWARIADETNCAVELVHHSRKTNGAEVTVEDARGASALIAAARSARALNVMSDDDAGKAGVTSNRRRHFRADNGKASMAPPPDGSTWFYLQSVSLGNGGLAGGDSVGVVETWEWPSPLDGVTVHDLRKAQAAVANGRWRENVQAKDWVGIPIALALGLDVTQKAHKARVRSLLQIWIANGMFVTVEAPDEGRKMRVYVEVGEPAND